MTECCDLWPSYYNIFHSIDTNCLWHLFIVAMHVFSCEISFQNANKLRAAEAAAQSVEAAAAATATTKKYQKPIAITKSHTMASYFSIFLVQLDNEMLFSSICLFCSLPVGLNSMPYCC